MNIAVKNKKIRLLAALCLGVAMFIIVSARLGLFEKFGKPAINPGVAVSAPGNISISMAELELTPFDTLIISGKNLDPLSTASVIMTDTKGKSITIPATSVTADAVTVLVPPVAYDKNKGAFGSEVVSVQAVQANKDGKNLSVKSSNVITDIVILPPIVPSILQRADAKGIPTGTITREFVMMALKSFNSIESLSIAQAPDQMNRLLAGLDIFIKNPKTKIALKTNEGTSVYLDKAGIVWLDAFYSGMLGMAEKSQMLAAKENSFSFVSVAHAAGSNCRSNWEAETHSATALQIQLSCFYQSMNFIDREGKSQSEINNETIDLMKKQALLLGSISVAAALGSGGASVPIQVAFGITYTLLTDYVYNGQAPGEKSIPGIASGLADSIFKMPNWFPGVSILTLALDVSNERCVKNPIACYASDFILADPLNARAFLFVSPEFNKIDVEHMTVKEYEDSWQRGVKGIDENGKEVGTEPDILPAGTNAKPAATVAPELERSTMPKSESSPAPVKSNTACAAGYAPCGQGCMLASSTCCPGGAASCRAGTTCTSDNMCAPSDSTKVVCPVGHEVCGKGCMTAGDVCCPGGTISCRAGSTCTSDNRCAPSVESTTSGCAVGYEVCGNSCMTAGRTCCTGTSVSCPAGNTCTPDGMCLAPESDALGGEVIGGCLEEFATMDKSNMTPEQLREAASCGFDF
jgi:hypothetical protein